MQKLWRLITSLVFLLTLALAAFEFYRCIIYVIGSFKTDTYQGYLWLAIGKIAFLVFAAILFRRNLDIIQTMAHEGAHMLVGGLFLRKKISEFNAKSSDSLTANDTTLGYVASNTGNNIIMLLAPYMLPYITFVMVFIRLMIKNECLPVIDFIIGFTLMFHISCWKKDTRSDQSDLQKAGVLRSFLYIFTFVFFNLAIILYSLGGGLSEPVNIIHANVEWFSKAWQDIQWVIASFAK